MKQDDTSLSNSLISEVICFNTDLGTNSESFVRNAATDLGPLLSLLLNSLPLRSLGSVNKNDRSVLPKYFISQLRVIILFGEDLKEFGHWVG